MSVILMLLLFLSPVAAATKMLFLSQCNMRINIKDTPIASCELYGMLRNIPLGRVGHVSLLLSLSPL